MNKAPPRFMRLPEVEEKTGLKHSQIHYLEVRDKFPKRVKIAERASGWLESEINDWIWSRVAASRDPNRVIDKLWGNHVA